MDNSSMLWLIPAIPFVGAVINGLAGKKLGRAGVSVIGCGVVLAAFVIAVASVMQLAGLPPESRVLSQVLYHWIPVADVAGTGARAWLDHGLNVDMAFRLDPLSAIMILIVTGVGFLIHVYSTGYMNDDPNYSRFFTYLNLFIGSMLVLVLAANFLLMYVGWELVGLCSYLLIGFWSYKPSAANAATKAFLVNRVGDYCFTLGVLMLFTTFGTLDFVQIFAHASAASPAVITSITLLLFIGATGKSAQIPLYVWLPDAMEGPTPVSALIHAATMVTAGVYMVARCHVLYDLAPTSALVVACVGAATAIYAASIALVQFDIKKVLAYSTISQLGYMFMAVGMGAYTAGIFHLMTHAFFKALLFLGAGSVMHSLSNEVDMRRMGAMARRIPSTHRTFLIATLAIAGIPPLAGFFSKDDILYQTYQRGQPLLWAVGLATALMTAFYMFRLYFRIFQGSSHVDPEVDHHVHESPVSMTGPLWVLAILSVVGGWVGLPAFIPLGNWIDRWLEPVFATGRGTVHVASGQESLFALVSVAMAVAGIAIAWSWFYKDPQYRQAERFKARAGFIYNILLNKYGVDEAYKAVAIRPGEGVADGLSSIVDPAIVDGILVRATSAIVAVAGEVLRHLQTGYVRWYAWSVLMGALVLVGYFALR